MAVTHNYMAYVVEKLTAVSPIKTRRMFSGVGIYRDARIFALIANDTLYFKTDTESCADFKAFGMEAFQPVSDDPRAYAYYRLPDTVLGDRPLLAAWIDRACAAGLPKDDVKVSLAG
ncbi:TfoX/Sxy family protein [Exilibacterium tricleocarpae]|uniref:TfoX/Sxy family protein n=1 Tax=Exilibacterium tricleocarpae TaxID=2591008 RepID=A0A545TZF2_9GAMM|nr:TfoX/Sxy family protein [Exilibacterium tricleocarpae]TQV82600.1 TfoX/Sxy family protein [Exilibacterium tricleocarpae]